jgi:hypothetical protein
VSPFYDVELLVGAEAENAAVVIPAQRLSGIGLERAEPDQVAVERQRRAVLVEAVDAVPEQRHRGQVGAVAAGRALYGVDPRSV